MNQAQMDNYLKMRFDQEIDLMQQAIDSYNRNKPDNYEKLIRDCEARIFNAALNVGSFDKAVEYARTPEQKKLYTRLMMAFIRDEKETCKCSIESMPTQGSQVEIPLFFNWRRVYDQRKGVWIDVYKCSKCNFMTTHPNSVASHSARKLERFRNSSEALRKNKPTDSEALR